MELRYWGVPSKVWVPLEGGSLALRLQSSRSETLPNTTRAETKAAAKRLDKGTGADRGV